MTETHYFYTNQKEDLKQYCQQNHLQSKGDRFIIAKQFDQIVGFGALSNNIFHPYNDYLYLHVLADFRSLGIASTILQRLKAHQNKSKLQCLSKSDDSSVIQFLNKNHFLQVRTTLDLDIYLSAINRVENYKLISTKLSKLNSPQLHELKKLIHHNYSKYHHHINPLNKAINAEQLFLHTQKDLDWNHSYVLIHDNNGPSEKFNRYSIQAYFLVSTSFQDKSDIILIGGNQENDIQIHLNFFCWVLNKLADQFKILSLESDDTDFYTQSLSKYLKIKPQNSYYTFIQFDDQQD